MLRFHITGRHQLSALLFFLIVVASSLLYMAHVKREAREGLERTKRFLQRIKTDQGTRTAQQRETDIGVGETDTSITQDVPESEVDPTETFVDTEGISLVNTGEVPLDVLEVAPMQDVRVSPYGFGPYPEVPPDFPSLLSWNDPEGQANLPDHALKNIELLERVLIKLWTNGDKGFRGGSTYNGRVYPHYDNTVYVRYTETEMPDGTIRRYPTYMKSGPQVDYNAHDFLSGNPPDHLRILELDSTGIDPYQFLDLP